MKIGDYKGKNTKSFAIALILMTLSICCVVAVSSGRSDLIIRYHVKGYQAAKRVSFFLCFLSTINLGWNLFRIARRKRTIEREKLEQYAAQSDLEYKQKKSEAYLSISGKLDSSYIQKLLEKKADDEWISLDEQILCMRDQLEDMDRCQKRLSRLLSENGATSLSSTQEVLDKVEQYLCRNVRKCLNYMGAADPMEPDDIDMVSEHVDACITDNKEKLKQIDDFIRTVVEFLNKQGDEEAESSISLLDVYKKTILESISGENKEEKI